MSLFYEVDFIPVGTGEKGGDAAALRIRDDLGDQLVFVVDGGTKDSGKTLVSHIREHYGTSTVNGVISTHPDGDHSSGLTEVLENMDVHSLFMHKPWEHADAIKHLFENRRLTTLGLNRIIREELEFSYELKTLADRRGIPIVEPFAGGEYFGGLMQILGPSLSHYQTMLPHYRTTPDPVEPAIAQSGFIARAMTKSRDDSKWVSETMMVETLTDEVDHFSAENSASAVVLFNIGGKKILFTGDADINALTQAVLHAANNGISLTDLEIFDVPHHGSRHNLGPTILRFIRSKIAHISAPPESNKHPSKRVINALVRRGAAVYSTQGKQIYYRSEGIEMRPGWSSVQELPFSTVFNES